MSFSPVNVIALVNAINITAACWMTLQVPTLLIDVAAV